MSGVKRGAKRREEEEGTTKLFARAPLPPSRAAD